MSSGSLVRPSTTVTRVSSVLTVWWATSPLALVAADRVPYSPPRCWRGWPSRACSSLPSPGWYWRTREDIPEYAGASPS